MGEQFLKKRKHNIKFSKGSLQDLCNKLLDIFGVSKEDILDALDERLEPIIKEDSLSNVLHRTENLLTYNIFSRFIHAVDKAAKNKNINEVIFEGKVYYLEDCLNFLEKKIQEEHNKKTEKYFQYCITEFRIDHSEIINTGCITEDELTSVLGENKRNYKKEEILNFIKAVRIIAEARAHQNKDEKNLREYVRFLEVNYELEYEEPTHLTERNFQKYFSKYFSTKELLLLNEYFDTYSRFTVRDILEYTYLTNHIPNNKEYELDIFLKAIDILMKQNIHFESEEVDAKELVNITTCVYSLTSINNKSYKELIGDKKRQNIIDSLQLKIQKYNNENVRGHHVNWRYFKPMLCKNPKHLELFILYKSMSKDSIKQFKQYIDQRQLKNP
ncbi:hypothetical protein D3C74_208330 [compost metagenome]